MTRDNAPGRRRAGKESKVDCEEGDDREGEKGDERTPLGEGMHEASRRRGRGGVVGMEGGERKKRDAGIEPSMGLPAS